MHFYWRIIEELKYLNESWSIKDPSLLRAYERWVCKNAESISLFRKSPLKVDHNQPFNYKGVPCSLS